MFPSLRSLFIAAVCALCFPAVSGAGDVQPAAQPASSGVKRTILNRQDVPNSNHEVVVVLVEVPPQTSTGRHMHPGAVVGYVMEGAYTMLVDGQPPRALKRGEHLELAAGVVHDERTDAAPAKLLVVFTVEKGKPLTTPIK